MGRANEEQAGGGEADSTDLDEEEGAGTRTNRHETNTPIETHSLTAHPSSSLLNPSPSSLLLLLQVTWLVWTTWVDLVLVHTGREALLRMEAEQAVMTRAKAEAEEEARRVEEEAEERRQALHGALQV
jgi:hypothetical protein